MNYRSKSHLMISKNSKMCSKYQTILVLCLFLELIQKIWDIKQLLIITKLCFRTKWAITQVTKNILIIFWWELSFVLYVFRSSKPNTREKFMMSVSIVFQLTFHPFTRTSQAHTLRHVWPWEKFMNTMRKHALWNNFFPRN